MTAKRSGRSANRQVAALPWRLQDGERRILLITSRETRRWVVPKGGRMAGRTDPEAAAEEAVEEAGVQGVISQRPIGSFRYAKRFVDKVDQLCVVAVYPMLVFVQLGAWREMNQRKRRWMTPEEAAGSVDEQDLADLIRAFGRSPVGE